MDINKYQFNQQKLIEILKKIGKSNKQLSDELGIHENSIGAWRRGINAPGAENLGIIAAYCNKDINYFYDIDSKTDVENNSMLAFEFLYKKNQELIEENTILKKKVEEYEKAGELSYSLQHVPTSKEHKHTEKLKK